MISYVESLSTSKLLPCQWQEQVLSPEQIIHRELSGMSETLLQPENLQIQLMWLNSAGVFQCNDK